MSRKPRCQVSVAEMSAPHGERHNKCRRIVGREALTVE